MDQDPALTISVSTEQDNPQAAIAAGALGAVCFEQLGGAGEKVFGSRERLPGWERATPMNRSAVFLTAEETVRWSREIQEIIDRYRAQGATCRSGPPGGCRSRWSLFTPRSPSWPTGVLQAAAASRRGRSVRARTGAASCIPTSPDPGANRDIT